MGKKIHVECEESPSESVQRASTFLERVALASSEEANSEDVLQVITDTNEWLAAQPESSDLSRFKPLRSALEALCRQERGQRDSDEVAVLQGITASLSLQLEKEHDVSMILQHKLETDLQNALGRIDTMRAVHLEELEAENTASSKIRLELRESIREAAATIYFLRNENARLTSLAAQKDWQAPHHTGSLIPPTVQTTLDWFQSSETLKPFVPTYPTLSLENVAFPNPWVDPNSSSTLHKYTQPPSHLSSKSMDNTRSANQSHVSSKNPFHHTKSTFSEDLTQQRTPSQPISRDLQHKDLPVLPADRERSRPPLSKSSAALRNSTSTDPRSLNVDGAGDSKLSLSLPRAPHRLTKMTSSPSIRNDFGLNFEVELPANGERYLDQRTGIKPVHQPLLDSDRAIEPQAANLKERRNKGSGHRWPQGWKIFSSV